MITRSWQGTTRPNHETLYVEHLQQDVIPVLERIPGFLGCTILRRPQGESFQYRVETRWQSLETIRAFAGADITRSVVPPEAQAHLSEFDTSAEHWEVEWQRD
ncbi:MAG: antibiotic biosynthesis monooxygenase family protein [Phycisphaerales bacterium JB043]